MQPSSYFFGSFFGLLFVIFAACIGSAQEVVTVSNGESSKCSFTQKDSKFNHFYPLTGIPHSQPEGYYAKIRVSVTSDYGDIHILLAESDNDKNTNRAYEFAMSSFESSEIRRRNSVYGTYETLVKANITVEDFAPNATNFEISVSKDGLINVSVLNSNATIVSYHEEFIKVDFDKYRVFSSNYSLEASDVQPFPINFISFSGHSKLGFHCDYGVFRDKTFFIQTRCEAINSWSNENLFHPLSSVPEFQPTGYHAKLDVSMLSDYGNLHIILSETTEREGPNPCYEFVIGDRFSSNSEFRRKNSINENYGFVSFSSFSYKIRQLRASLLMHISVSVDGVLSFTDVHRNLTFNFADTQPTIPVKYITFAGYRNWPTTYQIDCTHDKTFCS